MNDVVLRLFDTSGFPPRWRCGIWTSELGWLHICSDVATWSAYMTIPAVLAYIVTRRRDVPFPRLFWLFAAFIAACGTTHLIEAIIFWWPIYRFSGLIKFITAVVSWIAVFALIPIANRILIFQSPEELREINAQLEQQFSAQQRADQRFRMFLEAAPDSMLVVSRSGRIVFANSQAEEMFQAPTTRLLNAELESLLPSECRDRHRLHREAYFKSPHRRPMGAGLELNALRFDGTQIPVEISLSPLQLDDELVTVAAVRDITFRREVESQLREQQQKLLLAERLAAIGETVLGLAHESRNALQRMQANLSLLRHRVIGAAQPQIDAIQESQDDLCHLFDQLRAYATPPPITKSPCKLADIVHASWEELSLARKRCLATLQVHDSLTLTCFVDSFAMRQLFRNIIENSLQAADKVVQIDVFLDRQERDGLSIVEIRISDNGIGLSLDEVERVFTPFYTTKKHGMGLGLSITQRIVAAHGGTISIDLSTSAGTTFVIRLPVGQSIKELAHV